MNLHGIQSSKANLCRFLFLQCSSIRLPSVFLAWKICPFLHFFNTVSFLTYQVFKNLACFLSKLLYMESKNDSSPREKGDTKPVVLLLSQDQDLLPHSPEGCASCLCFHQPAGSRGWVVPPRSSPAFLENSDINAPLFGKSNTPYC